MTPTDLTNSTLISRVGEVTASPTSYTVLDRLKSIATNTGTLSAAPTLTDKSGTITLGGSAQVLAAANSARRGFSIQNLSTNSLWIRDGGTAAATQPSFEIVGGALYEYPLGGCPTTALSIYGATTSQAFAAREW